MLKRIVVFSIAILLCAGFSRADEHSKRTHFYEAEFKRPVKGAENVGSLDVSFYVPIKKEVALKVMRQELELLVATFSPECDILPFAWDCTKDVEKQIGSDPEEEDAKPVYSGLAKKIMTWKELRESKYAR